MNIAPEEELNNSVTREEIILWMKKHKNIVSMDILCEGLEKYIDVHDPSNEIPSEVHDFIRVKPKIPLHLYSLVDSFTKLNLIGK